MTFPRHRTVLRKDWYASRIGDLLADSGRARKQQRCLGFIGVIQPGHAQLQTPCDRRGSKVLAKDALIQLGFDRRSIDVNLDFDTELDFQHCCEQLLVHRLTEVPVATHHGIKHTDRLTWLHRSRHIAVRVVKNLLVERLTDHALIDAILLCHGLENLNSHPSIRLRDIDTRKTFNQRQVRGNMRIELIVRGRGNNLDPTRTRGGKQRLKRFHGSSGELNHLVELVDEQHDFPTLRL